jgi:hypothetical protein
VTNRGFGQRCINGCRDPPLLVGGSPVFPEVPVSLKRNIIRTTMTAAPVPGFAGDNHLMIELITPDDFINSDPFILLTDHRLDVGTGTIRAPHPHAGFETVTLFLEGSIRDRSGGNVLGAGDLQWMTAGSGIIHKEDVEAMGFTWSTRRRVPCLEGKEYNPPNDAIPDTIRKSFSERSASIDMFAILRCSRRRNDV